MTNLNDLITALEAGNYDEVLKGTNYVNAGRIKSIGYTYAAKNLAGSNLLQDSVTNAARCIVLEAACRDLMDSVWRLAIRESDSPGEFAAAIPQAKERYAATKKLVGGGE